MSSTPAGRVRPTPLLTAAGHSHPGTVRSRNEDAWSARPPVFVVADGMGGHAGGEVASRLVVEAFDDLGDVEHVEAADIEERVRRARAEVDALAMPTGGAPGSTVVVAGLSVQDGVDYWIVASLGDSRAYVLGDERLDQVSHDHSVVQELIDEGRLDREHARHHPERHVITRAIGAGEDSQVEFAVIPVRPGSRLLLCSDGLTSELEDSVIAELMRAHAQAESASRVLVEAAVAAGGRDNVTVVVVDVAGDVTSIDDTLTDRRWVDEDTVRTGRR